MTTFLVRFSHLALFAVLLAACSGGGTTTLNDNFAGVDSIEIDPTSPSIAKGTSAQLSATALYSDNSHADVSADMTWSSSNPSVATVSSSGKISAVGTGTATITGKCAAASVCGSAPSTITVTVTPASLKSVALTPPAPRLAPGTSQQFAATGTFSDNTTQNLSADLTWTSSNPAVATVSSSGLVSTVGTGSATITAACKVASVCGSLAGSTLVTVTSATLVSIAITPPAPSVALGTNETFTATGTYSDNSTQNLTTQVTWTSATPAVATISNAVGTAGVAHPVATGTTQVTAALGSVTSPAVTLTVTAATLVSIAITPSAPSVALGNNKSFTATGTYSDSSTLNLTTQVTWTSGTPAVATISNAAGTAGVAHSVTTGTTQITAALGSVTSPAVTLTVTAATLVSIAITPTGPSITVAASEQFIATGTYSDSSTQVLTTTVTWASSTTSVATISNASNTQGLATGLQVGSSSISATLDAVTSPSVTLTVTAPTESVFWSFGSGSGSDGKYPPAGLVQGTDGNFYGTTGAGGANNHGTIIKITPTGVETVLYSFAGGSDGIQPQAGLIQATDANFYGTTNVGGATGYGAVFKITPAGVETVLWSFGGTAGDGRSPSGTLIQGADGNFYGTTRAGGANGTVFKITLAGVETVLYSFAASGDGGSPFSGLSLGTDGNFYGTTFDGGANFYGTIFKITPGGIETVLYSFAGGSDGKSPLGGVIQGTDGNFYGTTELGGANNAGTVFKY